MCHYRAQRPREHLQLPCTHTWRLARAF
jgi:hypothetical protein